MDGIFQYFYHNIGDIEIEIRILIDTIEDTDQFVSIHLDTVRYIRSSAYVRESLIYIGTL